MSARSFWTIAISLLGVLALMGGLADAAEDLAARATSVFGTLPAEASSQTHPSRPSAVALGRLLYFDPRLSKNHEISCNSCHPLDAFGADGEPNSPGHRGQRGDRNSPTVYNAALQVAQFWDGRAADVEEQAKGPVLNPIEMAMPNAASVEAMLNSIPGYPPLFGEAFAEDPDPVSFDNMALAIAAFERQLLTPSPFDDFLGGDVNALSKQQRSGLRLFMDRGCITCHMGVGIGGSMFQKLGLVNAYETGDPGRFKVTGNEGDRRVFKVPSLRNVAKTAPYFHDGSVKTLPEVIRLMGYHQLGLELSDAEVADIAAFLDGLTGQIDPRLEAQPELPASGPDTPKPDPS